MFQSFFCPNSMLENHRIAANRAALIILLALSVFLTACGGGGGNNTAASTTPPAPPVTQPLPPVDVSTIMLADKGSALAPDWQRGAFIEIYVRGYQDSDGDGVGDLKGLIQRLDYLKDLGIKGIWLMPVTKSQDGDHGYAVSDYRNIETAYGSLADFDELLKQAHDRGIGIIIDYVMNHSAAQHPLFVNSRDSDRNAYRDWYVWQASAPTGWNIYGGNPWRTVATGSYFAPFWDQMPDFNLLNPSVVEYHKNNLRFWLNLGVDGFRFDAVGNLVENGPSAWLNQPRNYTLMNEMRLLVAGYSNRYVVCEAPDDPKGFAAADACGGAFGFQLQIDLLNAARGNIDAINKVSNYFKTSPIGIAPILANHDSFAGDRIWDQLGGNINQYKLAAATYLLMPGTPFIYYGEEIGIAGGAGLSGDSKLRTPMSWSADTATGGFTAGKPFRALAANVGTQNVAAQQSDANSLLSFYKSMLKLRNTLPSIAKGSYDAPFVSGSVMGYQRKFAAEQTLVLTNYGQIAVTTNVANLPAGQTLNAVFPLNSSRSAIDANGAASITIPAQSVRVYTVSP